MDHPQPDMLLQFLQGDLDATDVASVESHLEHCEDCCLACDTLSADCDVTGLIDELSQSVVAASLLDQAPSAPDGYELREPLGRGGFGVVYRAHNNRLNREVALKFARGTVTPSGWKRCQRESRLAASLVHPNIVQIYDAVRHDGGTCLAMELVEGGSLSDACPANLQDAIGIVIRVARAVHFAHTRGIVHRDIKPANILLQDGTEPKVTDFGLARLTDGDSQITRDGNFVGTPSYTAPEQFDRSEVAASADIYSIGAVLYEVLTGRPPFRRKRAASCCT